MKEQQDPILSSVIDSSQNSVGLINLMFGASLPENQVLKHFVLWVKLTKNSSKEVSCNHRAHSNWTMENSESAKILAKIVLVQFVRKIGIRALEEILTDLRIGGINDTEDNVN